MTNANDVPWDEVCPKDPFVLMDFIDVLPMLFMGVVAIFYLMERTLGTRPER